MKPLKNFSTIAGLVAALLFLSQCSRLSTSTDNSDTLPTKTSLSGSDSPLSIPVGSSTGSSSDSSESSGDPSSDTDSETGITEGTEESTEDASLNQIAIDIIELDVQASAGSPAEIK